MDKKKERERERNYRGVTPERVDVISGGEEERRKKRKKKSRWR